MVKKDTKPRLILWVLLLHEFDFDVTHRIWTKNQVVDHLSLLEDEAMRKLGDKTDIDDTFPDEYALAASQDLIPWFADFTNYLASDIIFIELVLSSKKKFHVRCEQVILG